MLLKMRDQLKVTPRLCYLCLCSNGLKLSGFKIKVENVEVISECCSFCLWKFHTLSWESHIIRLRKLSGLFVRSVGSVFIE